MVLFDKNINIKNYDCMRACEKTYKIFKKPYINLYIQSTPICNASCYFCNTKNKNKSFDYEKLKEILKELNDKLYIGKISITGGEPLLDINKTEKIINICRDNYINLNTNGFDLSYLKYIYDLVDEIDLSKHHYDNKINNSIMNLNTPSLKEFYNNNLIGKIKINCVYQKGYIDCYDEHLKMLDYISLYDIKELRSISLLPLTEQANLNYVNLSEIMKECEKYLNDGYLYDYFINVNTGNISTKEMCKCFEYIYISKNKNLIKNVIRETINDNYDCVKQLVYDGKNLYDGFRKNTIIY